MDLSKIDLASAAEQGATMQLKHPVNGQLLFDGEGDHKKAITITLAGRDSERFQRAYRSIQNRRLGRRNKEKQTVEQFENETIELLARATLGWQHITLEGAPLEFSEQNARRLYERLPWVREQIDEFIEDRQNFFKG